ncbi:ABC transporter ATP-binding protein [Microvirga sp. G4-2]|uniref:ABC transporter ATP-binding protein n=1 Tax=Microvirga sp. G4-2 TaxID=3434467 RepID=UPI00404483EF
MTPPILELSNVTKRFGALTANDQINLSIEAGEIHAIVGENGAGKSTLMKILSGIHMPDEGQIRLKGQEVRFTNSEAAMTSGIGMVHQHFSLIPSLSVAENIVLSHPPTQAGVFRKRQAERDVAELSERYGLPVNPRQRLAECRIGIQQRVEILKALYRNPDILILDEPTAVLTPQETDALIENLRRIRANGKTIIFITHKLKEVMALADRVTVMRAGRAEGTMSAAETSVSDLATKMVGRTIALDLNRLQANPGEAILELDSICCRGHYGGPMLDNVSLVLRRGEILGIAGVEGNGQSELVEVVAGLRTPGSGRVKLNGMDMTRVGDPARTRALRVGHIPEDRIEQGLAVDASLRENLIMGAHDRAPIAKGIWINTAAAESFARHLIDTFDIRPQSPDTKAGALSGGNMQKAIIARELSSGPDLIIASHPTRGVDVGAAEFVYEQLLSHRCKAGILLVSSDLDEVTRLSDRIIVMFQGRIMAELSPEVATGEMLGLLMAGIHPTQNSAAERAAE